MRSLFDVGHYACQSTDVLFCDCTHSGASVKCQTRIKTAREFPYSNMKFHRLKPGC